MKLNLAVHNLAVSVAEQLVADQQLTMESDGPEGLSFFLDKAGMPAMAVKLLKPPQIEGGSTPKAGCMKAVHDELTGSGR